MTNNTHSHDDFLENYVGKDEDVFYNAPHRSPRIPDIERQLNINSRNRPINSGDTFYIDMANKPDGVDYCFAQCYTKAEGYTPEVIDEYSTGGWRLVKRLRHPELSMLSADERAELSDFREEMVQNASNMKPVLSRAERFIRKKGLVLMEKNSEANQLAKDRVAREVSEWSNSYSERTFNSKAQPFNMKLEVNATRKG